MFLMSDIVSLVAKDSRDSGETMTDSGETMTDSGVPICENV